MKDDQHNWCVQENGFDIKTHKAWEGLMTQGNGYMHLRASLEEDLQGCEPSREYIRKPANVTSEEFPDFTSVVGFYLPGIYGKHFLLGEELVNLPHFTGLNLSVEDQRLDPSQCDISDYQRTLNLNSAMLTRTLVWNTPAGPLKLTFERFISAADLHTCGQRLTLESDQDLTLTCESSIDADVRTNGFDHFKLVKLSKIDSSKLYCEVHTDEDRVEILSETKSDAREMVFTHRERQAQFKFDIELKAKKKSTIEKMTVVKSSRDNSLVDLNQRMQTATQKGFNVLFEENRKVWENCWRQCDIVIDSEQDDEQLAVRISLFHLLRCKPVNKLSIDAKGYAGEAYFGRFFWDTEIQMLPFYIYTFPDAARNLVDFRLSTLEGAKKNASSYGYPGAKYPWESSLSGTEQCACWQYADHEIHIGADIVYALEHFSAAANHDYLPDYAADAIIEIARYYCARMDIAEDGSPRLLGVMGPDEYTPLSSNNAYTNTMVKKTLRLASLLGEQKGLDKEELIRFQTFAEQLPIPREGDLILQCDEFNTYADPRFDTFWKDRNELFSRHVSQERLYRSKCLKQADVLMLFMLFPDEYNNAEVKAAWETYMPLTTHDSSLSPAVHGLMAMRLGLHDAAYDFWHKSLFIDTEIHKGKSEEGIHIAACGMNWQLAVFGFAGVSRAQKDDSVLRMAPGLPKKWKRLSFPLVWRHLLLNIDITLENTIVHNLSNDPAIVEVHGEEQRVEPQSECWFKHGGQLQGQTT